MFLPGDAHKPRRPCVSGHGTPGAGRGASQVSRQVQERRDWQGSNYGCKLICFAAESMFCHMVSFLVFGPCFVSSKTCLPSREIVGHKRLVQNNKQLLSSLRRKARDRDLAPYRLPPIYFMFLTFLMFPEYHPTQPAELTPGGPMRNFSWQSR